MHLLKAFTPIDGNQLTEKEKLNAISSLMFPTEKRDGTIKAQACANGRKQQEYMSKEEVAAPMVILESIFVTAAIEAKEGRDITVMDLPGAFLYADNDDEVIMMMKGMRTHLFCRIFHSLGISMTMLTGEISIG